MSSVKTEYQRSLHLDGYEPKHLGFLLDRVTRRMKHDLDQLDGAAEFRAAHEPLTPPYFRLLSLMPRDGARITDLVGPAGMTKQALGQFMDVLLRHGYVSQELSPADRRVRIVRRTDKGDEVVARANRLYEQLDERWEAVLGADRLRTLKGLLGELAVGWDS